MQREIITIDAENKRLGALATEISSLLIGKNSAQFEYHIDGGAKVIVYNTNKLSIHPNKIASKTYYRHSGYPGGIKSITAEKQMAKDSTEVLRKAVHGMLPKNRLRAKMLTRLVLHKNDITK
jgi:large subunit ribosomal protein L13